MTTFLILRTTNICHQNLNPPTYYLFNKILILCVIRHQALINWSSNSCTLRHGSNELRFPSITANVLFDLYQVNLEAQI